MLSLITGIFPWYNSLVNHAVAVGTAEVYDDLIRQVAEYIEQTGMTEIREVAPEEIGMDGNKLSEMIVGNRDGWNNAHRMLERHGLPTVSRMAFDYVQRKKKNPKAPVMSHEQILLMSQIGMNNITGEGFNAKSAFLYNNKVARALGIFWGWPLYKMAMDHDFIFRPEGEELGSYLAFVKYLGLVSAWYMPLGLSAAFMIDWYDEEALSKPNNLPPITPWAALPVVGPMIAMSDEEFTLYSVTSRLAKAGSIYGMGFDVANSIFSSADPYGSAREFSLDSRVFAFSMFKNILNAAGAWYHQGEADYASVIRPAMYGLGGNSVIQGMDLISNLIGADNEERRVADYIGARNYIKKTAWVMGLRLRPPYKGGGKPNPVTVNVRQMERAAYANDTKDFLHEYQEAVEAAREWLSDQGRDDDPEEYVIEAFKDRDLRRGITRSKITDADWKHLLGILDPDARQLLEGYVRSHKSYINLIKGKSGNVMSSSELRRREMFIQYSR